MSAKRKPQHFVNDLSFAEGWLECSCGLRTIPDPETFADHRRTAGAPTAWASDAIRTDRSANFMPATGPGRPRIRFDDSACLRGHTDAWRVRRGTRECRLCFNEAQRASRHRAKAVA